MEIAVRATPVANRRTDPLARSRIRRPAGFGAFLYVHPDAARPTWVDVYDALEDTSSAWYSTQAEIAVGGLLQRGYGIICYQGWPVLDRIATLRGTPPHQQANLFQFRLLPAHFDIYAVPSDRPPGDVTEYHSKQGGTDLVSGAWRFMEFPGQPIYELRPLCRYLFGWNEAQLDTNQPNSLDDLIALADALLAKYRSIYGPQETLATLLQDLKGPGSLSKQVLKRAGLARQDPVAEVAAAATAATHAIKATVAARKAHTPELDTLIAAEQAARHTLADLKEALPSRTFQGWPIEQALAGALMEVATPGEILRDFSMLDYRSMYPLCAADCGLWELQRARYIESRELPAGELEDLRIWLCEQDTESLAPATHAAVWPRLNTFCRVRLQPGDRLVRNLVAADGTLSSRFTTFDLAPDGVPVILHLCLADVLLSWLWSGQLMDIEAALEIWPAEQQALKPVMLFGEEVDLTQLDPYRYFVACKESAPTPEQRRVMKAICVTLYGITGEAHSPRVLNYGTETETVDTTAAADLSAAQTPPPPGSDTPGPLYCPAVAALITAAARLRLGCQVLRAGGFSRRGCAAVHTDSLIVPAAKVADLLAWERPGDLRLVNGDESGQPLHHLDFCVWDIGRHAAWQRWRASTDIKLHHFTRAGFNYAGLEDDQREAGARIVKAAIVYTADRLRPIPRPGWPGSPLPESGMIHLLPGGHPTTESFWQQPLAVPFKARPDKLWLLHPAYPEIGPMQTLLLTIAANENAAPYVVPADQWAALQAAPGALALAGRPDRDTGGDVAYSWEFFNPRQCATFADLARNLAKPKATRLDCVPLTGTVTLPRRDFEQGRLYEPERDMAALITENRLNFANTPRVGRPDMARARAAPI